MSARDPVRAVDIRLLGPVAWSVDGRAAPTGGPRQRSVLAILAIAHGHPLSLSAMIDRLWGDDPPPTAAKTIQVYVSRIRRNLGSHADRLVTTTDGYLLSLEADELDTARFERRIRAARTTDPTVQPGSVVAHLSAGLREWRGPALADLEDEPFARHEATRLAELRGGAIDELLEARSRIEPPADVLPDLRRWTAEHPERERLWALLMRALYLDGRQAEALETYLQARRYLVDERGIDPSPALRHLERQILLQDPALGGATASSPSEATSTSGVTDLLIGRTSLLASIVDLVGRSRFVTLLGPGGVGKTSLAAAAVDALRVEREAIFLDASRLTDAAELPALLASGLGSSEGPAAHDAGAPPSNRQQLVALDNVEQIRDVGQAIARLLESMPSLHVLVTSRIPTRGPGERELLIAPLAVPHDRTPDAVERAPASALFLARARAIGRFDGPLDPATAASIAILCHRLDGLPLAIELAAARTRILPPAEILDRLDDRAGRVLMRTDGPPRHRSLESVLDWTLSMLSQLEWDVLASCAICPASFDLDLVAAITTTPDPEPALDQLVALGLVATEDPGPAGSRFRVLETVRIVVIDRIGPGRVRLARRHARAILRRVASEEPMLETRFARAARTRLDLDLEDIEAAVDRMRSQDPPLAVDIIAATLTFRIMRGVTAGTWETLESILPILAPGGRARARAVAALARLGGVAGRERVTAAWAHEAVRSGRRLRLPGVEMEGLYATIMPSPDARDLRAPIEHPLVERALSLTPTGPRQAAIATEIECLVAERDEGVDGAIVVLGAALERAQAAGATRRIAYLADGLAERYLAIDRPGIARSLAETSVGSARLVGDLRLEMFALSALAVAASWESDAGSARGAMARALVIASALDTPFALASSLQMAALVVATLADALDGARLRGAALAAFDPVPLSDFDDEDDASAARWVAARATVARHRWDAAVRSGQEAGVSAGMDLALRVLLGPRSQVGHDVHIRPGDLSPSDIELMTMVGEGGTEIDIAAAMGRSPRWVEAQLANLRAKVGAADRTTLATLAHDLGLVRP